MYHFIKDVNREQLRSTADLRSSWREYSSDENEVELPREEKREEERK